MLPAHYYPAFKKYSHFVGNYGNAWWKQREEFTSFNGPILFTTNCIVPPLANAVYKERMFTTNSTAIRVASTLIRMLKEMGQNCVCWGYAWDESRYRGGDARTFHFYRRPGLL